MQSHYGHCNDHHCRSVASAGPYVPGDNKQQYLRGGVAGPYVPGGNKRQYLRGVVAEPYVPGGNKQQYLRNFGKQTRPVDSSVIPLLTAENPLFGQQTAQTLPSPIVFAPAAMTNTQQTKPFIPQTQTYVPLIRLGNGAQTLPSQIVFDETKQTRPVIDTRNMVQTLPASSPYIPGGNKQQYVRSNQVETGDPGVYPGVAARPNFPPGFISRMLNENLSYQDSANGPKNVLYFF